MPGWGALIDEERNYQASVAQKNAIAASTKNIFRDFRPRAGGQSDFFKSVAWDSIEPPEWRWFGLIGGIGSGKSYCGAAWACSRALLDPRSRGMISANSYGQLARATLIALVEFCRAFDIPLEPYRELVEDQALAIANHQRCYIGEERAFVYVISATSFTGKTQVGRGLQIRWFWGDEYAYAPEKSFLTVDGRLGRGPGVLQGQGILTTSPAGYNYVYYKFADTARDERTQKLYKMQSVSSLENVESLGEIYVDSLAANYTDELYQQEVEGAFVNTEKGLAYKYFSRKLHTIVGEDEEIISYDPYLPLLLAFDFNAMPCVAVAAQQRREELHFFKEWFLTDADLWELTEEICEWIEENGIPKAIELFGDATGRARSAGSRQTNWDIIFEGLEQIARQTEYEFLKRRFPNANPLVRNRINSFNCLLKQNRAFFSMSGVPHLIKDLEEVTWTEQGINKENILLTHLSDAAGYLVHEIYPYRKGRSNAKSPAETRSANQRQKKAAMGRRRMIPGIVA